ncbi:MAG: alanine racemase [Candidatus Melainabacteria bacterium]|nr:MAG: alanine racemase [Candidatus Melainabacteria bacterium]
MLTEKQTNLSLDLRRDAWLEIDLDTVRHNLNLVKSWTKSPIMGVVKGDAYGHGAVEISRLLLTLDINWLGVASAAEALDLRDSLCEPGEKKARILILSPAPESSIAQLIERDIDLTVTSKEQIEQISSIAQKINTRARIHLKMDSGMHRLGARLEDLSLLLDLVKTKSVKLISIYSHLAKSGDLATTKFQHENFVSCLNFVKNKIPPDVFVHLANSEATRNFSFSNLDMVRIGLYLYGLEARTKSSDLKPAIALKARITHLTEIKAMEGAGYDWTFVASKDGRLASIPVGYADGVPRRLSNKIIGYVHGKPVKQAGTISMDQMLFDVSDVPEVKTGDIITLLDANIDELNLAHWAELDQTITYELACALALRLPRIYNNK